MKKYKNHEEFQNAIIEQYNITIETNSKCYSRTHIHTKERKICKWKQCNSVLSTFTLLHEIGHAEANNSKMRRCEEEFYATQWAIDKCEEYGIKIPSNIIDRYQKYVWRELDRGIRRGGSYYQSKEEMTFIVNGEKAKVRILL